jgi:hypothetical protein
MGFEAPRGLSPPSLLHINPFSRMDFLQKTYWSYLCTLKKLVFCFLNVFESKSLGLLSALQINALFYMIIYFWFVQTGSCTRVDEGENCGSLLSPSIDLGYYGMSCQVRRNYFI